jgi:hypothetical protein
MVLAAPLNFERPHGGVDTDLSIGDVEEAVVAPCGVPAVLADPVPLGIIIANATDSMTAFQSAADMVIDAAVVTIEIRIDGEAPDQGATSREPLLHRRRARDLLPFGDLCQPLFPVRAFLARLIARCVGKAGFVDHAGVLATGHSVRPPSAGRAAAMAPMLRLGMAVNRSASDKSTAFAGFLSWMRMADSKAARVPNATHEPHVFWSRTGVT